MGVPSRPCAVHVCANWCGHGFVEQCFARGPCWCGVSGGGHALSRSDFAMPPPLAWQRPSSPVNEVGDPGGMAVQSGWKRGCQCVKGCWLFGGGFAPPTQEVGCVVVVGVWWNFIDVIVCLLVLTSVLLALFVDFRWRLGLLEEQDGAVVGVPSLLPQLLVHWVYKMHASCHAS